MEHPRRKPVNAIDHEFPPGQAVTFDIVAFDDAIVNHGVAFVHHRAMKCPVGIIDQFDSRNPHGDHAGCSNGFLYTRAGLMMGLFTGNSLQTSANDFGLLDGSTVQVTFRRFYEDKEELVQIAPFDRVYLSEEDITVPHWQLVEAHATGRDRLKFPAVEVLDLVDAQGNRYTSADYRIENGQIVWVGNRPGVNADGKGRVYSIRYTYRPFWYVQRLMHEVRVVQVDDPGTGYRKVFRAPQACLLQREYVFEKEQNEGNALDPDSPRQLKGPADGKFGPR